MDLEAPVPQRNADKKSTAPAVQEDIEMPDVDNPSVVKVIVVGSGGAGINLARSFLTDPRLTKTLYFDTSMTNTRRGEDVHIFANGSGSGSHRAENAALIEREVTQLSDEELGITDSDHNVAIVISSLGGGSGSVINPLLLRDYVRRGIRVIGVFVADTSSSVTAKNNHKTLQTLTSICKNNNIYLPCIMATNDHADSRTQINEAITLMVSDLIDLLTQPVYEVDRNDRLNWVNPTKIVDSSPGIKFISITSSHKFDNPKIILGAQSKEMVDSMLILQSQDNDAIDRKSDLPPARLKKTGFFYDKHQKMIVGKISSDITDINPIIDFVEKMGNQDRAQKHQTVSRLESNSSDDMIL